MLDRGVSHGAFFFVMWAFRSGLYPENRHKTGPKKSYAGFFGPVLVGFHSF
ncbi:hypothetical protein FD37_GL000774 [Levilactobacillus spicheri DSM 15429]|uniref:Uncharacterized protein n=1 Tax=Levilactobacillus spicheri DSM 15429 TaxID=1423805 RepID=A0A0R1QY82_9LACO|nr:hypothetical protein FD37_GL000774 [Levilactobacillus spicheri DSM 15429]